MSATIIEPDLWGAIDKLAARQGLSASGLAQRAGLDPTCFNQSKRGGRWPSTETIFRVCAASLITWHEFMELT